MSRFIPRRATLSIVLFVAGCAVGPDFVEPEVELADAFVEAAPSMFVADPITMDLWRSLDEVELDGLIDLALQRNTTIAQALATLNETRALSGLSIYSWFPTMGIGLSGERSRPSPRDPFVPPAAANTVDSYRAGFDMAWEIDLFGSLRRQTEAIQQRTEADLANFQAVQLSIVAEVAQAYFTLRGAQQRLRVLQRNLDNQADSVNILSASLEAGRGTALDVARTQALERSLAAQLPQSESAVSRAEQRLAVLTVQTVVELRQQLSPQNELPGMPAIVAVGSPQDWLRRRPDVRAAERSLAAATADIGVEVAEFYPQLNLTGNYGWTSTRFSDLGSSGVDRFGIGPSLSWRILDFGRIRQRVLAAEARAEGAYAQFEETLLLALEETENSLAGYRATTMTAAALVEALEHSRIATQLANLRFDNGVDTYLAVLDAERTLLDLEDQYAVAVTDQATALAALYKALGGDFVAAR
jgi:outer membrane protein, multidrug efflux system